MILLFVNIIRNDNNGDYNNKVASLDQFLVEIQIFVSISFHILLFGQLEKHYIYSYCIMFIYFNSNIIDRIDKGGDKGNDE